MAYIGNQPALGNFVKLDAIVTSATATYNLLNGGVAFSPGSANQCIVSLNGVIQEPTSASNVGGFTISGSTIVFTSALTSVDVIDFILVLGSVLNLGTPSDGTVTTAKLAGGLTVTHAVGAVGTPSITFDSDSNTGIFSPAADTIAFTEGGAEAMRIDSSANLQFNSGFGSVATAFGCRAWVNFNGTGTPAIRGSGNVSSITDNGTGDFTINFTTAMPDTNYTLVISSDGNTAGGINPSSPFQGATTQLTTSSRVRVWNTSFSLNDSIMTCIAFFR